MRLFKKKFSSSFQSLVSVDWLPEALCKACYLNLYFYFVWMVYNQHATIKVLKLN